MKYNVCGPFEVPRGATGLIDMSREPKKAFWKDVERRSEGLSGACGCYIFGIKSGRGLLPQYVGRTRGNTFKGECFTPHKLNHYNAAVTASSGRPMIFFLPKVTPGGAFARISTNGHRDIDFLESYLIGVALERNANLLNKKDTKFLREMEVRGILNDSRGRPTNSAMALRSAMGL